MRLAFGKHRERYFGAAPFSFSIYKLDIFMNDMPITHQQLNDAERVTDTAKLFGMYFPLRLEPTVFAMADRLAADYSGGYWDFYALTNGGFYMARSTDRTYTVTAENGYEGVLSADALGITACLYAYSHLSFTNDHFAEVCAEHFHLLREYAMDHPEARVILAATA